jgi:hypothetical protein
MQKIEPKSNISPDNDGDVRGTSDPTTDNKQTMPQVDSPGSDRATPKPESTEKTWSRPVSETLKTPNVQTSGAGAPKDTSATPAPTEPKGVPAATPSTPKAAEPSTDPKGQAPRPPSTPEP